MGRMLLTALNVPSARADALLSATSCQVQRVSPATLKSAAQVTLGIAVWRHSCEKGVSASVPTLRAGRRQQGWHKCRGKHNRVFPTPAFLEPASCPAHEAYL
eukprot:4162828-Amphidinium_carterae.1